MLFREREQNTSRRRQRGRVSRPRKLWGQRGRVQAVFTWSQRAPFCSKLRSFRCAYGDKRLEKKCSLSLCWLNSKMAASVTSMHTLLLETYGRWLCPAEGISRLVTMTHAASCYCRLLVQKVYTEMHLLRWNYVFKSTSLASTVLRLLYIIHTPGELCVHSSAVHVHMLWWEKRYAEKLHCMAQY